MATSFSYILADFPLGVVDTTQLWIEIDESTIVPNLVNISRLGDTVTIDFDANLSPAEEIILDGVVAAHQGNMPDVQEAEFVGINRDPTVNDDLSTCAGLGTRWFNTTTFQQFVCLDPTIGAAVWKNVTQSSTEIETAEIIAAGDLISIDSTGKAVKAISTFAINKWRVIGVAINSVGVGGTISVAKHGDLIPIKFGAAPAAASNGTYVFLNDVAGEATIIPPLGGGEVRFLVGVLKEADGITDTPNTVFFPQYVSRRPL